MLEKGCISVPFRAFRATVLHVDESNSLKETCAVTLWSAYQPTICKRKLPMIRKQAIQQAIRINTWIATSSKMLCPGNDTYSKCRIKKYFT